MTQTPPNFLVDSCDQKINLFGMKPEKTIYNVEIGYTIHYRYQDRFPSKEAFGTLYNQLTNCGWKQYDALEFTVNDIDWLSYLEGRSNNTTVVIHRFGKTYIDKTGTRLAVILVRYISKVSNTKEALYLDKPNNDMQLVTLQFMPFDEKQYKKVLDEYQRDKKVR